MRAQGLLAAGHFLHAHLKNDLLRSEHASVQNAAVFSILILGSLKPCLLGSCPYLTRTKLPTLTRRQNNTYPP